MKKKLIGLMLCLFATHTHAAFHVESETTPAITSALEQPPQIQYTAAKLVAEHLPNMNGAKSQIAALLIMNELITHVGEFIWEKQIKSLPGYRQSSNIFGAAWFKAWQAEWLLTDDPFYRENWDASNEYLQKMILDKLKQIDPNQALMNQIFTNFFQENFAAHVEKVFIDASPDKARSQKILSNWKKNPHTTEIDFTQAIAHAMQSMIKTYYLLNLKLLLKPSDACDGISNLELLAQAIEDQIDIDLYDLEEIHRLSAPPGQVFFLDPMVEMMLHPIQLLSAKTL